MGMARGLRVAFVSQPGAWGGPPEPQGSIEIWTHEVARRLAQTSDVRVYRPIQGRGVRRAVHDGVSYIGVGSFVDKVIGVAHRRVKDRPGRPRSVSPLHLFGYAVRVARDVRRFRPDVIHVQNHFPFVRTIARFNRGSEIVLHMHGEWISDLDRRIIGPALRRTAAVVACSDHVTNAAKASWPEATCRWHTVPNGVDASWLGMERQEADPLEVLFVGRISPEKGLHDLIEAFVRVADRFPGSRLKIIGPHAIMPVGNIVDVSYDPAIRDLARFYRGPKYWDRLVEMVPEDLAGRVEFINAMPQSRLVDHYRTATVLVNPSFSESFGMSVIEAMALGTPVVAASTGGMVETVEHGVNGLSVPPGDVAALADALDRLLSDADLRRAMGQAGRRTVAERYTWDRVATAIELVYPTESKGGSHMGRMDRRFGALVAAARPVGAMEGPTLVIAPHPDDEALGCGGTIASLTAAGEKVGVVFMTDGGLAGPGGRVLTAAERSDEARQACEVLGVKPANTWFLGHPDGALGKHAAEATERLAEIIQAFAPARVFLPHRNDVHPDHVASFRIGTNALEGSSVDVFEYPIWLWDHYPWTPQPLPFPPNRRNLKLAQRAWKRSLANLRSKDIQGLDTAVDISGTRWIKRTALDAYRSQLPSLAEVGDGRFLEWFDQDTELFRVSGR